MVAVLGYAWYVSHRISSGALDPPVDPRARRLEVMAVHDNTVVLRELGDSNAGRPGTWGLEWGSDRLSYAQVADVLSVDRANHEVTRRLLASWPTPPMDVRGRLDNSAFPTDPRSHRSPSPTSRTALLTGR